MENMKIKITGKSIDSKNLLEHLRYLNDTFKEIGTFGFLNSKGLNNYSVLNNGTSMNKKQMSLEGFLMLPEDATTLRFNTIIRTRGNHL